MPASIQRSRDYATTPFSLYVALLEEVSPPNIQALISRRKILPELWGKTLACRDFFCVDPKRARFQVIIGNPPWSSRRGSARSSVEWSRRTGPPMPVGEDAWAFSWKALAHLTDDGLAAFLLPSMGFLHNHSRSSVEARNAFFLQCRVRRVINFSDLRFQLFEKAHQPAALFIYGPSRKANPSYRFDYWTPKADLNLRIRRVITLSSADKLSFDVSTVIDHPLIFRQWLWMREPDAKLFAFLERLPAIGDFVSEYGDVSRHEGEIAGRWVIGQGYQPLGYDYEGRNKPLDSVYVGRLPDLPISAFVPLAQPTAGLKPASTSKVRRRGFEAGFKGVRVLVPQGVDTRRCRLGATYCEAPFTFEHILQAISVPNGEVDRAKLLAAFLNSRLAVWYAFHGTGSFDSYRPKVHQEHLLRLPLPTPSDLPDKEAAAEAAARELIDVIDNARGRAADPFSLESDVPDVLRRIDHLVYRCFGLNDDEVAVIEDTVEFIIPALQPHDGSVPELWRAPDACECAAYAAALAENLRPWFRGSDPISRRLLARSADLGIAELCVAGSGLDVEHRAGQVTALLERLSAHIDQPLDGNLQLKPDLRVSLGECLYVIKPMQLRFWLESTALADADAIALDLQQAVEMQRRQSTG